MTKLIVGSLLGVGLACALFALSRERAGEGPTEHVQSASQRGAVPFTPGGRLTTLFGNGSFSRVAWRGGSLQNVDLVEQELPPGELVWEKSTFHLTTSYAVEAVAPRGGSELFLAGLAERTQETVLEQWVIQPIGGAYVVSRPSTSASLGTPVGSVATVVSVAGGTYVPSGQRPEPFHVDREELWRGTLPGRVVRMAADPDGRFLLAATDDGVLRRFLLDGTEQWTVLYDQTAIPALGSITALRVYDSSALGRLLVVHGKDPSGVSSSLYGIAFDAENDGIYESTEIGNSGDWKAAGLHAGRVGLGRLHELLGSSRRSGS